MIKWSLILLSVAFYSCQAQTEDNANQTVPAFHGDFGYGSNFGYYSFSDQELADLAAGNPNDSIPGAGVTTIRPALPEQFLEQWGYDIRHDAFAHYTLLGLKNNVAFIGYPSVQHTDTTHYCPAESSKLFRQMYTPIWDNGENGTPVNDENLLALYVYKTVQNYGDHVRIWEIWNEPDFDHSGNAWKPLDMEGNWWENDPLPCDYALKAPVYHYIRMLRVCYEVIKSIDPEDFVAVGGLGYPAFLDVILRNTDNPDHGQESSAYPLGGGAYFDMMSFHSYPHIDGSLRMWRDELEDFEYFRHSDRAAEGIIRNLETFDEVLEQYGYGVNFPKKPFIITECNIPRKEFGTYIGSDEAQRNFIIKALVKVQEAGVLEFHIYQLAESKSVQTAANEFELMGLYKEMTNNNLRRQVLTQGGIAYKTTSTLLKGYRYDKSQTTALYLPEGVAGAAFRKGSDYIYVLWSVTHTDKSEQSSAKYSFPEAMGINFLQVHQWNWSETGEHTIISSQEISLSGAPIFVRAIAPGAAGFVFPAAGEVHLFPNPASGELKLQFQIQTPADVGISLLNMEGKLIAEIQPIAAMNAGFYQKKFNYKGLESGIYFIRFKVNNKIFYMKFLNIN